MLDIKFIRENCDEVIEKLNKRGKDFYYLKNLVELDDKRRKVIGEVEQKKAFKNSKSKEIGRAKAQGLDIEPILEEVANIGDEIKSLDVRKVKIEAEMYDLLLKTPNGPRGTIPEGTTEEDNIEVSK